MADTEMNKAKRDVVLERLRGEFPDKKFEDEEEIYGQINDDYDQYEQEINGYKDREQALADMFYSDPRSAQFLSDMHNGMDPRLGLIRTYGIEIEDMLHDPEMQEQVAAAQKDYLERVAKSKELDEQYDKNMDETLATLAQFQTDHGMTDEEGDKVFAALLEIVRNGVVGKFPRELMEQVLKAQQYEGAVANAEEEGRVAGRNDRIVESLRKSAKGDGTQPLSGKNGRNGKQSRGISIFDFADAAR